ncbi:MAG: prepilin-type N-terminal cleavage/methylation domain-containing protein [Deltaproteobacteria bacterium]|nr:prepilin-type N-terminal cleavage/methylation domain-containing protein [Deltaproteobacteria bacterium]
MGTSQNLYPIQPKTAHGTGGAGFSLLELIIVLIILSIVVGLLLPRVGAGWKRMEDRDFLQEFVQTLKRARLISMNSGEIVAFRLRSGERLYDLKDPPLKPIPLNVDIYADHLDRDPWTGDHIVLFYPDGSLSGSNIQVMFDQQRSFLIAIHPITGSIQLSRMPAP